MKTDVLIETRFLSMEDFAELNAGEQPENHEVEFLLFKKKDFLPSEAVIILINSALSIGYVATYDIFKHIILKVFSVFSKKRSLYRCFYLALFRPVAEQLCFELQV